MLKYRFGLNGAEDELAEWSGAPLEQSVAPTRPSGAPQALVVVATPLTALPDIDRTSSGIATGNVFTGVNTLTGAAGKDFGGVAPYEFAAGDYPQTYGVVSFDAKGNYTYARTVAMADVPLAAIETIYYVSSDAAHNPSNVSTLTIILNPEATAVVNTVAKTASGTNYDETIHAKDPTLKILGLGGDDILVSGTSGSTLDGGTGQDTLKGSGSADVLIGGAGGDQLNGGGGANDTASYETSIGVVTVSLASGLGTLGDAAGDILTGVENLTGGKGNDQLTGDVNQNIIHGNAGNDTIDGGDGSDTLFGDAGNDIIYGGGAGDVGNKNDYLHGGLGNDQLHGDRGEDQLFGDAGADHLDGGADNDTATYQDSAAGVTINLANLAKNTGDAQGDSYDSIETFIGTAHVDTMVGDATAHTFYGFDGNDKLSAGTGGDKLNGGYGNDVLIGGIGDDVLGGDQGDDKVSGGDGADTLIGSLGNDVLDGGAGADVLQGSYDDDKLFGGEGSDVLYGEENNDVLDGGAGTDNLIGDIGDDVLIGGAGADSFNGGSDFDYVSYETSIGAVVASLLSQTGTLGDAAGDAMINVEGLKGGAGDDQISGDAVFNKLFGGAGNDILFGDNGNDDLHGGLGNDTLQGGVGTDALFGDAGADHFEGGADTDVATYQDSTAAVVINLLDLAKNTGDAKGDSYDSIDIFRGSTFADTITGDANGNLFQGDKGNDKLAGGAGIDTLSGDLGDDTLNGDADGDLLYGGEGNDKVFGGTGADQLNGENGNDTINGGDDADVLLGGDGNDTLIGGAGADSLFGDAGTDTLTGGAGSDTFAFAYLFGGYGKDKITDFNRAEDTLSISNILDGAGNDIQDLIDAGFGASSSGTTLNVTWNGGASAVTVTGWTGGEVNDVQTLGLILGSHLVVTH